jgi:conjugative transfer signal peptidase TraF
MLGIVLAGAAGLRVNASASMPWGLWRVAATEAPFERGEIVSVCPPDGAAIREAARRGYLPAGPCPGGYEPLVKPVAAIAGDLVKITAAGVAVNGEPMADTAQLGEDSAASRCSRSRRARTGCRPAQSGCSRDTIRAASTAGISAPCRQRIFRGSRARCG